MENRDHHAPPAATVILACQTIRDELELSMRNTNLQYPVTYLESGLHSDPDLLRKKIQEQIDGMVEADRILMVFGCCGNGLVGIRSTKSTLIIPRIDDCITLLLGSTTARRAIPGEVYSYFLTRGWLDPDGNIMWSYKPWREKYGEQKTLRLLKKMLQHYARFTLIDTGAYPIEDVLPHIEKFCRQLKMEHNRIAGSLAMLEQLLTGPWDREFIILPPGQQTTNNDFYPPAPPTSL